jgi:hypothetical protein
MILKINGDYWPRAGTSPTLPPVRILRQNLYRVIEKECRDYKNLSLKTIKHIEMIQVLKC